MKTKMKQKLWEWMELNKSRYFQLIDFFIATSCFSISSNPWLENSTELCQFIFAKDLAHHIKYFPVWSSLKVK